ncbi:uncharacterized protein BDR25DRAFT_350982 [Lindgomyces ingoldianus]|uniref:Uncharacterized protein n=1 Tax=Lindgomyces ingoldianus TaxID=673940 RepID=A0ACB6RBA2_9PLEO|nr:uncharacterized protein BDR25DRAFT_350982 [Lindgomyces ingoldianus]KAF2475612.1 hypothetical protein BDR25DRAFT_350982 [Lindgomyces ingoldianus]
MGLAPLRLLAGACPCRGSLPIPAVHGYGIAELRNFKHLRVPFSKQLYKMINTNSSFQRVNTAYIFNVDGRYRLHKWIPKDFRFRRPPTTCKHFLSTVPLRNQSEVIRFDSEFSTALRLGLLVRLYDC